MNAVLEQPVEEGYSCVFTGSLGDITLVWDDQNKEHVLEIIRKKMEEGVVFFTTKKYMFGKIKRKAEVTKRDLKNGTLNDIIISDEEFEKMVKDIKDKDLAALVAKRNVAVGKMKGRRDLSVMKKIKDPEEIAKSNSVAIKPLHGG
jgi:hypothetical protein